MKFFLDENFSRLAVGFLQSVGHQAEHALDFFPPGTTDERLFGYALQNDAVFISTDKDFFHTIPLSFERHNGAIVITLRKPNRADLMRRFADALAVLGERSLRDTVWLVTDRRILSRHV